MNNRYTALDDKALVALINKGEHRAFEELFHRHKLVLYRHAYRMIADTELCNDIIQEVFLAVWAKHTQWTVSSTPLAYLYQAVRNKVLDHISHEKVVSRYMHDFVDFNENGICFTEESILEKELLELIEENKALLPQRTREIFELNKEQQLSYKEIAQKLSISEKTAKKQVHNALRYLRTKLSTLLFFIFFILFSNF